MLKFQYYDGDIKKSKPKGLVSLDKFIEKHAKPSDKLLGVFAQIEEATNNGDMKLKAELKMRNLFYFTPSAIFGDGAIKTRNGKEYKSYRCYENIIELNPLAQLDFDGLTTEEAVSIKNYLFEQYEQVVCAYLSPSRKGVKLLLRIPKIELKENVKDSVSEYKDYYRAIESEFSSYKGFDPAPKNLVLPLFISYDSDILYRNFKDTKEWDIKEVVEEPLYQKYPLPFKPYKKLKSNDKNELRAIRTVRKYISGIVTAPGHYQLRTACLIFGTRVGAGYVDRFEAEREIESLVRNNRYLAKGVDGYLTTAKWSLNEGIKTPNYYN